MMYITEYFEVSPVSMDDSSPTESLESHDEIGSDVPESDSDSEDQALRKVIGRRNEDIEAEKSSSASSQLLNNPLLGLDLKTLQTFYNFLSMTISTLPNPSLDVASQRYWELIALPLAFSRDWLMSGILAIGEYHASCLQSDLVLAELHREQAMHLFTRFISGREEASRITCGASRTGDTEAERRVGGQIMCVLRCAHWTSMKPLQDQVLKSVPFQLQNFVTALRSFSLVDRGGSDGPPEEVFARASHIFKNRMALAGWVQNDSSLALLDRLDRLPSLMTDVFGRPDNLRDVMATLSAIASLIEHFSFACEVDPTSVETWTAVWHSMVSLSRVGLALFCSLTLVRYPGPVVREDARRLSYYGVAA